MSTSGLYASLPDDEADAPFTGRAWVFERLSAWMADAYAAPFFLLTGGPGSGKTSIARQLVRMNAGKAAADTYPQLGPGSVTFDHFCEAFKDGSLDPLLFVKALSLRLADQFPAFAEALAKVRQAGVTIDARQTIGSVASGSSVRNVVIENLHVSNLSSRVAFTHLVRDPLQSLCVRDPAMRILILIDSLDEALTYTSHEHIVSLLETNRDLPPQVRFILTSRPDAQVLSSIGSPSLDLIADAPDAEADVFAYALRRLIGVAEPQRTRWAHQIAAQANGIFLYARYVLDDILSHREQVQNLDTLPLPANLQDHYRQYLKRELVRTVAQWKNDYRPIMGMLAVARGDGLTLTQIAGATGRPESQVDQALSVCNQYLLTPTQRGPFRIYHTSFRDFLLNDEQYHIFPSEANQTLANYLLQRYNGRWHTCDDEYALRYTPAHLAETVRQSEQPKRHEEAARLAHLVLDDGFQNRVVERYTDLAAINHNLELALASLAVDDDPAAIPLIVSIALATVQFRQQRLQPDRLFTLAAAGRLREAEGMLALFGAEARWRQAALLTCAWLAAPQDLPGAQALVQRVGAHQDNIWPLSLLRDRVQSALSGASVALPALPEPPPDELARLIVARMGGEVGDRMAQIYTTAPANSEALRAAIGAMPNDASLFFAEHDGPLLTAYAQAHPGHGEALFDQYVTIHATDSYTHYRNLSLWILLDAVLRHPDPEWARRHCQTLITAALSGERLLFQEGLGYTLQVLAQLVSHANADPRPTELKDILAHAHRLDPRERDPWSLHKRRLAALAEACRLAPDLLTHSEVLLHIVKLIDPGFAGFFTPACISLAETIATCRPNDRATFEHWLDQALSAAHNIQEPVFCAVNTARVNAMQRYWWAAERTAPPLDVAIRTLNHSPDGRIGAALHIVGEQYTRRAHGSDKHQIPRLMYNARSLNDLAEVYRQPVGELLRLNLPSGWGLDERLPVGAHIWIPDPGFPPLLAATLAAMTLVAPGMSTGQRVELLQLLVPVALPNPTVLDTVLARLLSVAPSLDPAMLHTMTKTHEHYRVDASVSRNQIERMRNPIELTMPTKGQTIELTVGTNQMSMNTMGIEPDTYDMGYRLGIRFTQALYIGPGGIVSANRRDSDPSDHCPSSDSEEENS